MLSYLCYVIATNWWSPYIHHSPRKWYQTYYLLQRARFVSGDPMPISLRFHRYCPFQVHSDGGNVEGFVRSGRSFGMSRLCSSACGWRRTSLRRHSIQWRKARIAIDLTVVVADNVVRKWGCSWIETAVVIFNGMKWWNILRTPGNRSIIYHV